MPEETVPPVWRKDTGHEAIARPICSSCLRKYRPDTATICKTDRPCTVAKCENSAAAWIIDTK